MAKRFVSVTITALLLFGMSPAVHAQATASAPVQKFSDVAGTNRNAVAINFLANNNIINGYPDGTFRPDQSVSRVEFLKIALLASNVTLDAAAPTGFKDVDETAWYSPYLKKAKKEGWVQGYADGTFKPTQSVNKAEGLKMLAEIQNWQIPNIYEVAYKDTPSTQWFGPFVAYAKWHGFLEETGNYFIPSGSLSRAKTGEILFRTLVTTHERSECTGNQSCASNTTLPAGSTPPPSPAPAPTVIFTPAAYQTASKTTFTNITLNEDFPNIFYVNEFYIFKGKINSGTYDTAFAFINGTTEEDFENNSPDIGSGSFTIPVIFRKPGNYQFGIIPGSSGESKYINISVLASLPSPASKGISTVPTNLHAQYLNQKTTFTWNNGTDNLAKIIFTQGNINKTFFIRQNAKQFDEIYNELQDFQPGQVSWTVQSAKTSQTEPLTIDTPWITSSAQSFTATTHTYSEVHPDLISYTSLPETLTAPGTITISGKTLSDIEKDAEIIRPDGKVDTVTLQTSSATSNYYGTEIIPNGGDYRLNYLTPTNGTYFVEINGDNGIAVINTPIYVNNGIPFVPDYFDLENSKTMETASTNILMNNLLNLINRDRVKYGFTTVSADTLLNKLAQNYSDDMMARNFFGHISPDGKTPDDRRLALGITTQVGENLADETPGVTYAHNGLMRSAVHRMNILNPDWTRVGIGITKKSDGFYVIVEEFSTSPPDAATLAAMKINLLGQINKNRQSAGIAPLTVNSTLASIADNWSSTMASQKFLDFVAPDGSSISANIQKTITNKSVQAYIVESNTQSALSQQLLNSAPGALSDVWTSAGLGLNIDSNGIFKLTLLLSN